MPTGSLRNFRGFFLRAPVSAAVLILDENNDEVFIEEANDAFCHMMAYESDRLTGVPIRAVCQAMPELHLRNALRRLDSDTTVDLRQEIVFTTKQGIAIPCQIALSRWLNESGDRFYIMSAFDITSRKAAEEMLLETVGIQQREDFIATLTHDLKTPIVGANMVLTALMDGSLGAMSEGQIEIIAKLKTSNQALLKMIQNLLEVYKYESGSEALLLSKVELNNLVGFCVEDIKPLVENKHLSIVAELPAQESGVELICDEYALKRVLINLLGNATKFTPQGGAISVSVTLVEEAVLIEIKDTGHGIDPLEQERLFQRFYQGEPGKRYATGTGLGLYFCHNVIKAHGGKITCTSKIDIGTTFSIELPLEPPGLKNKADQT